MYVQEGQKMTRKKAEKEPEKEVVGYMAMKLKTRVYTNAGEVTLDKDVAGILFVYKSLEALHEAEGDDTLWGGVQYVKPSK
jgi:hypothetical protein